MCWFDEGFVSEVSQFMNILGILFILSLFMCMQPEAISYELFT
jgi:hypothetical protein